MIVHDVGQNTDEWFEIRCGKPTASEFSKLVTSKGEPSKSMPKYAIQLAAEGYAGEPVDRWEGNQWTDRGHEMEPRARAHYQLEHPNYKVTQVGFITHDELECGASPDSLVDANDGGETISESDFGVLEIKCQKAERHIETLMYYDKNGRMPPAYVQQTQGQMFVTGMAWSDLLFWHPDLPALTIRTRPSDEIFTNLSLQIHSCIDERDRIIAMLESM